MATLWPQIKQLIDDGCSLIPVRDKDEGERPAKTPCISAWKQYQTERMDEGALWQAMQTYGTTAVAVVTGEVSGRLELIDIDSKYEPGIEALVLKDIEKLYPDLYPILRIHATPSGGRHIIYRIEDGDVEGNQKLAGREATEAELQAQRKKGRKRLSTQVNFLETRGEGGYFLYPPSMGYSVIQDVSIPQLTWEERCGIINLCRSYNRLVKIEPTPKPAKKRMTGTRPIRLKILTRTAILFNSSRNLDGSAPSIFRIGSFGSRAPAKIREFPLHLIVVSEYFTYSPVRLSLSRRAGTTLPVF